MKGNALLARVNGRWHRPFLVAFGGIVVAHWLEHLAQAAQIWVLGVARADAKGALGHVFPWLVTSEWLHYGYAVVMLAAFAVLLPGFAGRPRQWWALALGVQVWHHFEHAVLLYQALSGHHLFGKPVPTSFLQLAVQRAELHLFYNAVVTVPMLIAMWLHLRPTPRERAMASCSCARHPVAVASA